MATKKTESKVKQSPILVQEQEQEKTASESVLANQTPKKDTFQKSRRRTSLEEFSATHALRPEIQAGFRTWLKGQLFHFDSEWEELYKKYQNQ